MRKKDTDTTKMARSHLPAEDTDILPAHLSKFEFGKILYNHLLERGWSQSDMARASGLTRDSISRYVNGTSFPRPAALRAIAKALGVKPEQILGNYAHNAIMEDPPSFDIKTSINAPNKAWLRVERLVSLSTALKIGQLLQEDEKTD